MTLKIEILIFILGFFTFFWVLVRLFQKQARSLSLDILHKSQESFLNLSEKYYQRSREDLALRQQSIEDVIKPVKQVMESLEKQNIEIEKKRLSAYTSLQEQIHHLMDTEKSLRSETMNLSRALKSPNIRGSWGQIHLKRVVELAGLLNCCDFFEQKSIEAEGKQIRPDLVVNLPNDRCIVIDAKTPIDAYFEAVSTTDMTNKEKKLKDHAFSIKRHIKDLSSKQYWKQFQQTPEYVILFLPAESFLSAALQVDPTLIEIGAKENIVLASPTTLISILRVIAHIWKQDIATKNTLKIVELGKQLYDRLFTLSEHWNRLGKNLNQTVDAFNQASSSIESRVYVSARKLKDLGVNTSKDLLMKEPIDVVSKLTHFEKTES